MWMDLGGKEECHQSTWGRDVLGRVVKEQGNQDILFHPVRKRRKDSERRQTEEGERGLKQLSTKGQKRD